MQQLMIRKIRSDTPALTPQQEAQILDLYERPAANFGRCGRAYQIGINSMLQYFGYRIEVETEAINECNYARLDVEIKPDACCPTCGARLQVEEEIV